MGLTIGVDIGGTKIQGGVVDDEGTILSRFRTPTPAADAAGLADVVAAIVADARHGFDVEAVGVGVAGFVDEKRSTIRFSANLNFLNTPFRDDIAQRVGLPVVVENDANAAAWGECRFGAGRGHSHLVLLTLGTGVGSGFVFDGRLFRGGYGVGAEMGHLQFVPPPDGLLCGCGQTGCFEMYVSGRALVRRAQELAQSDPAGSVVLRAAAGNVVADITGPMVTAAARAADPVALQVFSELGGYLGQGFADLGALLDPTCFIVGGGVCEAGDLLLTPARAVYEANLTGVGHRPLAQIRIAELGNDAGLIGAADLARLRD